MPSKAFGPTDGVADTKTTVGSAESISTSKILGAFIAGTNVVAAKATSAILSFDVEGIAGPLDFAVSFGSNVTDGGQPPAITFLPLNIQTNKPTSKVTISMTTSENVKDVVVSLLYT